MLRLNSGFAVAGLLVLTMSCRPAQGRSGGAPQDPATASGTPLVLAIDQGERRLWRPPAGGSFILKVDRQNGRSPDLVMGYEDIAPGHAIPPHRHLVADEIIFVHRGSGVVELGSRTEAFGEGATIYIPKTTRITVRNTGSEPLSIAFVFSKPGFEEYLRDFSAPAGQQVAPLSVEELRAIRARHQWHTVFEPR
jgi:quercetin dioxygenase-like cupin family protein